MNIYLAVDYSTRMFLSESRGVAVDFICNFIDALNKTETRVSLIRFDNEPKFISENILSSKDVRDLKLLSKDEPVSAKLPNFQALGDLILRRQCELINYELIFILQASFYFRIPDDFRMPCAVYFVGVAEVSCATALLADCEIISRECAIQAGIKTNNNGRTDGYVDMAAAGDVGHTKSNAETDADEFCAIQVTAKDFLKAKSAAIALAKKKRTENDVTLFISPNFSLEVHLTPGLPKRPFAVFDAELLCKELYKGSMDGGEKHGCQSSDNEYLAQGAKLRSGRISPPRPSPTTLHLLGFIKAANFLLHLPSTSLIHAVKPKGSENGSNLKAFHAFSEVLGTEGQLAIFQHPNGEECFVRALRSDPSDLWLLCMQFYSSNYFAWATAAEAANSLNSSTVSDDASSNIKLYAAENFDKTKMELKDISYKPMVQRSYWTDAHGLQSDILKISRLLKRADRIEQFYQEIQRVSMHALACGYDSFAKPMATMLERRCMNIPPENRDHLVKVLGILRDGGFRLMSQP